MINNNEEFDFDYPFLNFQNNKFPNWEEIKSILKFVEELNTRRAASYDKIFVVQSIQAFASFFFACGAIFIFFQCTQIENISLGKIISLAINLRPDLVPSAIVLFFLVSPFALEINPLREMRRRVNSDSRLLGCWIEFLGEKSYLIDANLSDLEKTRLKMHMSKFDKGIGSLTPTPWCVNVLRLFFPERSR
jgi:hypothetical protein